MSSAEEDEQMSLLVNRTAILFALVLGLLLLSATTTLSAQGPAAVPMDQSKLAAADRDFARAAAQDTQAEIALAVAAQQTTSSTIVKMMAEQLQRDHLEAADKLRSIGEQKHEALPTVATQQAQIEINSVSNQKGSAFDRAFADRVIAWHRAAIPMFERYAASGADPELRSFADTMLPKLRKHLSAAEDVKTELR
jgi:putative membrane protein